MTLVALGVGILLHQCLGGPLPLPPAEPAAVEKSQTAFLMQGPSTSASEAAVKAPSVPEEEQVALPDYEGWEGWCEPHEYEAMCQTHTDCEGIEHPAKRPLRCVHPWWAKGSDVKVCAPGYAGKTERDWRLNRLRSLVGEYFEEDAHCADGVGVGKQHWRCQRRWRKAETLTKFLRLVSLRETSYRPWKRHRLSPDQAANDRAYVRQAKRYGVEVKTVCANGQKRCKKSEKIISLVTPTKSDFNPHYNDLWRWHYGLGLYGQVSALHVAAWDPMAPPEVLCREVVATESYLRAMRSNWAKLSGGVHCNRGKDDEFVRQVDNPTWMDLHHAVAGGSTCPKPGWPKAAKQFQKRADRVGLDPDQPVTLDMLGEPVSRDTQYEYLLDVESKLDKKWGASP